MTVTSTIVLSEAEGVHTLTLNRPAAHNALDAETMNALRCALRAVADAPSARVLVLRGAGSSFCVGGDVLAMHNQLSELQPFLSDLIDTFHECVMTLSRLSIPTIASVHGSVAGGGMSLVMACDLVAAAANTRFVTAYASLGAPSDGGLTYRLSRKLGPGVALELLTTRGELDASRALALRLVNEVARGDSADDIAAGWARKLLELPATAVSEVKKLVTAQDLAGLQDHLDREKAAFLRCAATQQFKERVERFAARARSKR